MIKATLALMLAMLCTGVGNILMGKGMKVVGPLESYRPSSLLRFFFSAITNQYVMLGVVANIGYFLLWLAVLSWADVSWALPMNGMEYIVVAFLALFFLKERVGKNRWIGISLISVGMLFMLSSW